MKYIALVNKLMPLYRSGVFRELSKKKDGYEFTCFGDTKSQGGIKVIPWDLANRENGEGINWVKTSNYFYIPERLLWQTRIVKTILFSKYHYFIFEGAVFHLPTWLFAALCRWKGKKVLFWTHGFKGFDKGIKKIIRRRYFKMADGLLLYGNYSRELMKQDGFDEKKLFVVYNSLDTASHTQYSASRNSDAVNENKRKWFLSPDLFTVIFIGRLVKAKNIQFLLDAVNEFSKKGNPVNCIIIGDGPEKEFIRNFITSNGLENYFLMPGPVYDEKETGKYFGASDMMVSPGNVGLNCIHSLAYGVPVLTHNNLQYHGPEVEAINPGQTGLLFEHNNYRDMIEQIDAWMHKDVAKEEVSRKCRSIVMERYNPQSHAQRIIEAIDQL